MGRGHPLTAPPIHSAAEIQTKQYVLKDSQGGAGIGGASTPPRSAASPPAAAFITSAWAALCFIHADRHPRREYISPSSPLPGLCGRRKIRRGFSGCLGLVLHTLGSICPAAIPPPPPPSTLLLLLSPLSTNGNVYIGMLYQKVLGIETYWNHI